MELPGPSRRVRTWDSTSSPEEKYKQEWEREKERKEVGDYVLIVNKEKKENTYI